MLAVCAFFSDQLSNPYESGATDICMYQNSLR